MTKRKPYIKSKFANRVAKIAKKAVMKVSETKKHSEEVIEQTINTNGGYYVNSLVPLPSGTGHGTRIGHKVNPIGIDIRGHCITNLQSTSTLVKIMVVRVKDMQQGTTIQNNLLETNGGNVTIVSNDVSKLYRRINSDSYEVLGTKYLNLQVPATNVAAAKYFRMWIPLKKIRTLTYEGLASIVPRENDIAIVVFAGEAGNDTGVNYELSYNSTFYFKDP